MQKILIRLLKISTAIVMLVSMLALSPARSSDDQLGRVGGATLLSASREGDVLSCMAGSYNTIKADTVRLTAHSGGVRAHTTPDKLVPLGMTAGIKLFMEGAMVVGLAPVQNGTRECAPSVDAGLASGDIILSFGGHEIDSRADLMAALQTCDGSPVRLLVRRGDEEVALSIVPVAVDGVYKLGIWVRDSMAGIGTMTFYDPETRVFGALGHSVNEVDTGLPMPLDKGGVLPATVTEVVRGTAGHPGELRGEFDTTRDLGVLFANSPQGIFGTLHDDTLVGTKEAIPVAAISELKTGEAEILSNISGQEVKSYQVEIVKIIRSTMGQVQDFMIRVTDPVLLERTGGIVQGMSGSPVLQDGKFVGAVTHVLVDDPTRGYGVFLENMCHTCYQTPKAA